MKKLFAILMVVALACTCAFAGVKVGASIGRDTDAMGLDGYYSEKGAVALGLDVEYVFDEGISLFADGSFVLCDFGDKGSAEGTCFAFEAGVGYVLPFDLPFNIEVGAGIKTKVIGRDYEDYKDDKYDTKVGGLAKLGLSFNLSEHFELGCTVSEQLAPVDYNREKIDFAEYLAANTGFKATVKYTF